MAPKLSEQATHSGLVVVAKFDANGERGFGFIRRDGESVPDVHFGVLACQGRVFKIRDRVMFIENADRSDRAFRVWKVDTEKDETS